MLIIGLNGSPNKEGNTVIMLKAGLDALEGNHIQTEIIHTAEVLKGSNTPFCTVCSNPCTGICSKGNSLGAAYEKISQADGIIIGSPVYFGTVSAQLKAFWDKTRYLRKENALVNIVGGALTVGATRFGGQETTINAMHDMMLVQGMTVVGDGFIENDAGHQGACAQRPAVDDQYGLQRAVILAKRVAEVAAATQQLRRK